MEFEVKFCDFDTSSLKPGIVSDKPFRVEGDKGAVAVQTKLRDDRNVEILERRIRECPDCTGRGLFSDGCRTCRESGQITRFLVKLLD